MVLSFAFAWWRIESCFWYGIIWDVVLVANKFEKDIFARKIILAGVFFAGAIVLLSTGCRYDGGLSKSRVNTPLSESQIARMGTPYNGTPTELELQDTFGNLALYSGRTKEDEDTGSLGRNSLFLRQRRADGTIVWRVLLTTGTQWREAPEDKGWSSMQVGALKGDFFVLSAKYSLDRRRLWLVCDAGHPLYMVVCSYNLETNVFKALIDGFSADEQPDGTILVRGKRTYLSDENGEPLGARWYNAYITPDGKIVRKGKLMTAEEFVVDEE